MHSWNREIFNCLHYENTSSILIQLFLKCCHTPLSSIVIFRYISLQGDLHGCHQWVNSFLFFSLKLPFGIVILDKGQKHNFFFLFFLIYVFFVLFHGMQVIALRTNIVFCIFQKPVPSKPSPNPKKPAKVIFTCLQYLLIYMIKYNVFNVIVLFLSHFYMKCLDNFMIRRCQAETIWHIRM